MIVSVGTTAAEKEGGLWHNADFRITYLKEENIFANASLIFGYE